MRKPEAGADLAKLDGVEVFALDVTDPEQVTRATTAALQAFGGVDVVFNNAGYGLAGPHEAFSDEQLRRQLDTNLLGVMRTTRAFLPHFRERKQGLFITTTSIGGLMAFPLTSAYHATKWALEGWSESLWYELGALGIGVKTVSPGGITTDFAGRSLELVQHPEYKEIVDRALAQFGDPERLESYSSPEQIADVVYEAATDGRTQLRYVAGADANAMQARRNELGVPAFMEEVRAGFLG